MGDEAKDARVEAKVAKAKAKALRPWYKKKRFIGIGVIVVLIAVIAATSGSNKSSSTKSSNTQSTGAPTTSAVQTPVAPRTLWALSGSGEESGPKFVVPSDANAWDVQWSYNCANFGTSGNFITNINGYGSADFTTDEGANQLGNSGSGVDHYYDTGTFSIDVNSECSWTVKAFIP